MKQTIGIIEFKSIAKGIEATDHMLKSGEVKLIMATPICPGKYIAIISGKIGSVNSSLDVGIKVGGISTIDSYCLPNISEKIFPAISGTAFPIKFQSLGVIETISALTSIAVGDVVVKKTNVELVDIRIAKGLGGKGLVIFTGDISSVQASIDNCINEFREKAEIISYSAIASPTKELIKSLF